ncbi:MAG: cell division protein FtsQ [Thermoleophilaceae bacterium]|nr:cell division protein FtsQ [Thermoleophilaceae bacterium]
MSAGAATAAVRRRISPRRTAARAARAVSPRLRRRLLLIGIACLVLAAGYQFWLRDSSLVAVQKVTVTGLTAPDSKRVRVALQAAGQTMTTLHVDPEALDRAVEGFPVVRDLEVRPDFPHGLRVHVVEYHAAAIAVSGGERVPVAGDGTILRGLPIEGSLPTVQVEGPFGDELLVDPNARAAAAVAGAAPAVLRARIVDVVRRPDDGLVARLREGPELIFGSAARLRAKWGAASRVLADLEARGASYVDLRIPGRPAAGGLAATTVAPVAPAGTFPEVPPAAAAAATDPAAIGQAAETAVPGITPADGTAPSTAAPVAPAEPVVPQAPVQPAEPLSGGAGGGATAAP